MNDSFSYCDSIGLNYPAVVMEIIISCDHRENTGHSRKKMNIKEILCSNGYNYDKSLILLHFIFLHNNICVVCPLIDRSVAYSFCPICLLVCLSGSLKPFLNKSRFLHVCNTPSLLKTLGKGEIAHNKQFLLFPQYFLPIWRTLCHFHQI